MGCTGRNFSWTSPRQSSDPRHPDPSPGQPGSANHQPGSNAPHHPPDHAAPFLFDDPAASGRDSDPTLVSVSMVSASAGRRRNGSRRGFRHPQTAGTDDGYDQRRCAVAGQPANTMLVGNDRAIPGQMLTSIDHRASEIFEFLIVQSAGGHCGQQHRNMNIGIAAGLQRR